MPSSAKILIACGATLLLASLSIRLVIFGAEQQSRELAREVWDGIREQLTLTTQDEQDALRDANESNLRRKRGTLLLLTDPPMASVLVNDQGFRSPALVPESNSTYQITTRYRSGKFSASELTERIAALSLKPHYLVLSYLFLPGLLCLGLGLSQSRNGPASESSPRPSTVKNTSSSLDTVLRSSPPVPPDGLYEHDPATPEDARFGRFVRGEAVGKGTMGQVYRCTSCLPGDDNTYALKVLLPEWSKAQDFRTRFEREVDVCRKFAHPNLVRAYDHGEKDGRLWMVMDYVDGPELTEWLRMEKRTETELVEIFLAIFRGLEYAHKVGVVHRDLKPGNIMVKKDSHQPVIADFGLAKGKHYATITRTNTTLGTPTYMAPEQITGGKGSPQSDLYSLGSVMYEALTGAPPFEEKDVMTLLALKLTTDSAPKVPEHVAGTQLRAIVDKLLTHVVEERYQTAQEVVEALSNLKSND